jgi:hypothetical protein
MLVYVAVGSTAIGLTGWAVSLIVRGLVQSSPVF